MNGTVPTLVVPMLETTTSDVDSRYRSLRDTIVRPYLHLDLHQLSDHL